MNWYYEREGMSMGPVTETELSALMLAGDVTTQTLVWRPDLEDWAELGQLKPDWSLPQEVVLPVPEPAAEPLPPPATEEPEIKVRPIQGSAPSPSRLKPKAPASESPPPPPPADKKAVKKPGLLKRLFGGGE
jgi:hypothetical protein